MPQFAVLHIATNLKTQDYFDLSAPQELKEYLQASLTEDLGIAVRWENGRCRLAGFHGGLPIHELLSLITTGTGWSLKHVAADKYTDRYVFEKEDDAKDKWSKGLTKLRGIHILEKELATFLKERGLFTRRYLTDLSWISALGYLSAQLALALILVYWLCLLPRNPEKKVYSMGFFHVSVSS